MRRDVVRIVVGTYVMTTGQRVEGHSGRESASLRPFYCRFPKSTAAVPIDISRFTLPQSSAILVKVGCRNPHSATADCSVAQIRGWELAESRMSIHATYPLQRTLAIHCSRLWKLTR